MKSTKDRKKNKRGIVFCGVDAFMLFVSFVVGIF